MAKQLGFILKPSGASEALLRKECDPVIQFESDFLEWCGGRTGIEQLCLEAETNEEARATVNSSGRCTVC